MKRYLAALVAVVLLVGPAYAATAQNEITPEDIAAADQRRRAVASELNEITTDYDAAIQRSVATEDDLQLLATELSVAERNLTDLRVEAEQVARSLYMEAGSTDSLGMLDSSSLNDISIRSGYLESLSASGETTLLRLVALEDAFVEQRGRLDELLAGQQAEAAELEELASVILDRLAAANAEYDAVVAAYQAQEEAKRRAEEERRRREEEARRAREATSTTAPTATTLAPAGGDVTTTTAAPPEPPPPPPPSSGGQVCPVNGAVSFTDTWGAPRSGGRTHQGVDMIAARGTPLVAIEAGTVSRISTSSLGGLTLWIAGSSGDSFYYAHLDGYAAGLSTGQSVSAGTLVGYVGNTGNAQYTVPHLHFEWHPGGGSAVNPYPLVAGLCF